MSELKRQGKKYERKNSASRAAREDGLKEGEFDVVEKDGGFAYVAKGSAPKTAKGSMKPQMEKHVAKEKADEKAAKERAPVGERPTPKKVEEPEMVKADAPPKPDPEAKIADLPPETLVNDLSPAQVEELKEKVQAQTTPVKPARQMTPDEMYKQDMEHIRAQQRANQSQPKTLEIVTVTAEQQKQVPVAPGQPPVTDKPAGAAVKCSICQAEFPDKATFMAHAAEKHGAKPGRLHKSKVESPTKAVWAIYDEMKAANPNVTRKEVIAECQRQGIAYYTARTQIQVYLTTKKESDQNAQKANGKKK